MSEIRDRAKQQAFHILNTNTDENYQFKEGVGIAEVVEAILSITEIAIVNRSEKMPGFEGWLKEIKD